MKHKKKPYYKRGVFKRKTGGPKYMVHGGSKKSNLAGLHLSKTPIYNGAKPEVKLNWWKRMLQAVGFRSRTR